MAGAVIHGKARSRSGAPIAEARVYFTEAPAATPDIAALTNGEGIFILAAPVIGTYRIECSAEGFRTASATVEVTGDQTELELVIELDEETEA